MSEMLYQSRAMATMTAHPMRKMYCVLLFFQLISLKLNFRENIGTSLTMSMSVRIEIIIRMIVAELLNVSP